MNEFAFYWKCISNNIHISLQQISLIQFQYIDYSLLYISEFTIKWYINGLEEGRQEGRMKCYCCMLGVRKRKK